MEKYKICPACGRRNVAVMLECAGCEADLSSTPVVDDSVGISQEFKLDTKQNTNMVRVCECGVKNLVQARKCSVCGEDISDIIPCNDADKLQVCKYILTAVEDEYAYNIVNDITIIGREHEMKDYLVTRVYVSRKHSEIKIVNGKIYIRNLSTTNFTFVNNQKIEGDSPYELHDGDEIGLGGVQNSGQRQTEAAFFIVRIDQCI